ncbi:MAG: glycosyltransferase family 9 protein [Desulfovibrionaceae bacterium]
MHLQDKTVVSHHGALGDFLCAWPALLALSRTPGRELLFDGPLSRMRWLAPLGYRPAPAQLQRGLRRLHADEHWPTELNGVKVARFYLDRPPDLPGRDKHAAAGRLALIPSVDPDSFAPPRELHRATLARLGVQFPRDWLDAFRRSFAAPRNLASGRPSAVGRVLLFPGAGHPRKRWPLVQFFALARTMAQEGVQPVFVLGPAEQEHGLETLDFFSEKPQDLETLERLLLEAHAVVGNDCGPLHLAGMLGIPGVGVFGPASRRQWGPPGLTLLAAQTQCRPCTRTTRDLDCPRPRCMEDVPVQQVLQAALAALGPK